MPVNFLQALVHSGNYVAGAWRDDELVAAAVAWRGDQELHSHVLGVAPTARGLGIGAAVKLHQRAWAAERAIPTITWTYDPLVRANGWLNLVRLGARAEAYYPNFYGPMIDSLNGNDETDRCIVHWATGAPLCPDPPAAPPASAQPILTVDAAGAPVEFAYCGRPVLLCQVPDDIVALRRHHPALAHRWRLALRATMGEAMAAGAVATSMTPAGEYVLEWP